jgi:hypothetical protein
MQVSMSDFYPDDTHYFFSFPLGHSDRFLFGLSPDVLDVVSARPAVCAGPKLKVVAFDSAVTPAIWRILTDELGVPLVDRDRVVALPAAVEDTPADRSRDRAVLEALRKLVPAGSLAPAQPFLDESFEDLQQMPTDAALWLNDKRNLGEFVPAGEIPVRLARHGSGRAFAESTAKLPLPCVVKVASSHAGGGVRVCRSERDLALAKKDFVFHPVPILVEEYLPATQNLCIHFGIPHDRNAASRIIGVTQQIVDPRGAFLGGKVELSCALPARLRNTLECAILPRLRSLGYFGVGGLDVLLAPDGRPFWIDANLRLTGTLPFLIEAMNHGFTRSMITFMATYTGSEQEFRREILSRAVFGSKDQLLNIIAMVRRGDAYKLNLGFFYDSEDEIGELARELQGKGLVSRALEKLATSHARSDLGKSNRHVSDVRLKATDQPQRRSGPQRS